MDRFSDRARLTTIALLGFIGLSAVFYNYYVRPGVARSSGETFDPNATFLQTEEVSSGQREVVIPDYFTDASTDPAQMGRECMAADNPDEAYNAQVSLGYSNTVYIGAIDGTIFSIDTDGMTSTPFDGTKLTMPASGDEFLVCAMPLTTP